MPNFAGFGVMNSIATTSAHVLLLVTCVVSAGFAQATSAPLPGIEITLGYSVNADYVRSRPALLISDQKVSPFFSHGSGPTGFETSFKRYVRNGLGIKADLSSYSDSFPPGKAAYCQPATSATGIACGTGLTFEAKGRAYYLTAGPEWKFRREKRFALFAQVLGGIVHARSKFAMSGADVQYANPFTGGVLLFTSAGFQPDRKITYSDSQASTGLALSMGGGFDTRLSKRLGLRVAMDYAPTFLARPVIPDLTADAQGRVSLPPPMPAERTTQDHVRLTVGLVWRIR